MKKLVKFCALSGLILCLVGSGITACAALMGGRYPNSGFRHRSSFWHSIVSWVDRLDGMEDWDHWDDCDYWDDDFWDSDDWCDIEWNGHYRDGQEHENHQGNDLADNDQNSFSSLESPDGLDISSGQESPHRPNASPGPKSDNPAGDIPQGLVDLDFSSVREMDLDISKGILRIQQKDGISRIQVRVEDKYNNTNCYIEENTLKIKQKEYRYKNYVPKIEIQIPSGFHFDEVSLDTGVGDSILTGISTSKLEMDTGVGIISFSGTVTKEVELDTGVGDITMTLTGKETDYNYKVDCGVGSILIGETNYSSLSRNQSIDNQASRTMELDCGVGNITISFTDSL